MQIGKRIKELRKAQDVTLTDLSEKSGVQIATLSRMENGKMTGTLESHIAIAKALGTDVTQLYSGIIREETKADVKMAQGKTDVFVHSDKASYEMLTTKVLSKKMMPVLLTLEPGGQTNKEQNKPGTERFLYIMEGTVEVIIGGEAYPLSKDNSLYFDASASHQIKNTGQCPAKVISVLTPAAL